MHKSSGGLLLIVDARRAKAHFVPPPGVRLLSSEGFGRIEIALPEGVDVESQGEIEAPNKFPIAIATTELRDCFHSFRMPLPSEWVFLPPREKCSRDRGWKRIFLFGDVGVCFYVFFLVIVFGIEP